MNAWSKAKYPLLAALSFALMTLFIKRLGSDIPVMEVILARSIVSLIISVLGLKIARVPLLGVRRFALFMRGVVGLVGLAMMFYAIPRLSMVTSTLIQYTYPSFTALVAFFFLKETLNIYSILAMLLSFLGVAIVCGIGSTATLELPSGDGLTYLMALGGAILTGIAYVQVRSLSKSEHPLVIILYFPLVCIPIAALALLNSFVLPTPEQGFFLLLVGLFTQSGQYMMNKGLQILSATQATGLAYTQVIFAALLGIIYFDEALTLPMLIGIFVIGCGVLLGQLRQAD